MKEEENKKGKNKKGGYTGGMKRKKGGDLYEGALCHQSACDAADDCFVRELMAQSLQHLRHLLTTPANNQRRERGEEEREKLRRRE